MQAIQGVVELITDYIVETKPGIVSGVCAAVCGLKTSHTAWHTLKNAESWTNTAVSLGGMVVGIVVTSAGTVMALTEAGWSPHYDRNYQPTKNMQSVACRWMEQNSACNQQSITITCRETNTKIEMRNQFEACGFLRHEGCEYGGFKIDCSDS